MIYTHIAAALLSAAIAAVSAWNVQSWRMDAQVQMWWLWMRGGR